MFPSSIPSYTPFTTPITLAAMGHTSRHHQMETDIVDIAEKVGIDGSADTNSLDYKIAQHTATIASFNTTINGYSSGSSALATPTITSFTNAQHNHSNAAGGGQIGTSALTANAISGFLLDSADTTTDLHNSTAITAGVWTDCRGNQNFTVASATSIIVIIIRARAALGSTVAGAVTTSRLMIDSAGTPITKKIGGMAASGANTYANPFAGASATMVTGLAPGTHTIKSQVYSNINADLYLRVNTVPNEEFYVTEIVELKK